MSTTPQVVRYERQRFFGATAIDLERDVLGILYDASPGC
jgi:hypothetical protein